MRLRKNNKKDELNPQLIGAQKFNNRGFIELDTNLIAN